MAQMMTACLESVMNNQQPQQQGQQQIQYPLNPLIPGMPLINQGTYNQVLKQF